tara:strand:+ start:158 stop:484 length:327 start_codon:yes stop_codon:yes gene_type:complete
LSDTGISHSSEWEDLRRLHFEGKKIFATNGSANYLVSQNIRPSAVVIVDARSYNAASDRTISAKATDRTISTSSPGRSISSKANTRIIIPKTYADGGTPPREIDIQSR